MGSRAGRGWPLGRWFVGGILLAAVCIAVALVSGMGTSASSLLGGRPDEPRRGTTGRRIMAEAPLVSSRVPVARVLPSDAGDEPGNEPEVW
jgi:hypothetical protein